MLLTFFVGISSSVNAVVIDGDYEIELHSVVYNPSTNLQNWTYNITCINRPGISHVVFEFKEICDPPLSAIDTAGPLPIHISENYPDTIPPMYKVGIKIDLLTSLEPGEWMLVWFTLEGEWPVGTIEAWIKAGQVTTSGIVDGPECRINNVIPEVPFGTVMAGTSMLIALLAYAVLRKRTKN